MHTNKSAADLAAVARAACGIREILFVHGKAGDDASFGDACDGSLFQQDPDFGGCEEFRRKCVVEDRLAGVRVVASFGVRCKALVNLFESREVTKAICAKEVQRVNMLGLRR